MAWAEVTRDGKIDIGAPRSEYHLAQQIPGCNYDKERDTWHLPLSWAGFCCLRELWKAQSLQIGPNLTNWAWDTWRAIEMNFQLRRSLDADTDHVVAETIDRLEEADEQHRLFAPQRGGAQWLVWNKHTVLGDDQGNGKTPQMIRAMQVLNSSSVAETPFPALVIAPSAALYGWQDELKAWAPELTCRVIDGSAAKRRKMLLDEPPVDVYLMSWANARTHSRLASYPGVRFTRCSDCGGDDPFLKTSRCEVHRKELNEISWRLVIADEAHRMADAKSKQTRAVWWLSQNAPRSWLATGSISPDHIGMLWPLLRALDPVAFPSKSRFLDLFAIKEASFQNRGATVLGLRPDTAPTLHAIVQPYIRRIPREVALPWLPKQMPPVFRYPPMSPAQSRMYGQLKKEALAEFEHDKTMVPANTLVKFSRLCQLAAASLEQGQGEDNDGFSQQVFRLAAPSSKVDDLLDFLADEDDRPVVVAANTPQLITLAETRLLQAKITSTKVVGGMSASAQHEAAQDFQDGKARVIFLQPEAGGEAITLTRSNTVYWMQPTPSHRRREQLIHRVDRIGSQIHDSIRVIHSISRGTVEERLYQLGCDKQEHADEIRQDRALVKWLLEGE